jgi:hypothetical protein
MSPPAPSAIFEAEIGERIVRVLEDIARGQRAQADLALDDARSTVLEGTSTGAQNASQLDGTNYMIRVDPQSGNHEVIRHVIAYTSGSATTLTLGRMKLTIPSGITNLGGLRLPLSPMDERSLSDTSAVKMSLWLMGQEAPVLRFSTQ